MHTWVPWEGFHTCTKCHLKRVPIEKVNYDQDPAWWKSELAKQIKLGKYGYAYVHYMSVLYVRNGICQAVSFSYNHDTCYA